MRTLDTTPISIIIHTWTCNQWHNIIMAHSTYHTTTCMNMIFTMVMNIHIMNLSLTLTMIGIHMVIKGIMSLEFIMACQTMDIITHISKSLIILQDYTSRRKLPLRFTRLSMISLDLFTQSNQKSLIRKKNNQRRSLSNQKKTKSLYQLCKSLRLDLFMITGLISIMMNKVPAMSGTSMDLHLLLCQDTIRRAPKSTNTMKSMEGTTTQNCLMMVTTSGDITISLVSN